MIIKIIREAEQTKTIWQQISVDAVVGIIGTLLGTVIGWFLNELSNRGKISVYVKSWKEEFYKKVNDGMMGFHKIPNQPENYDYKMTLEIHNSSNTPKIMRDVRIAFRKKKVVLQMDTPRDDAAYHNKGPVHYHDEVAAYNIPAHEIVTIGLLGYFRKHDINLDFLRDSDSVWLSFKDDNNKSQWRLIKNINYQSIFDNATEDIENG